MTASPQGDPPDSGVDPIALRESLAAAIVTQIERQGYYLTYIAPCPPQVLVDLRWAAQMASRRIGCHTKSSVSRVGATFPGRVTVVIAPDRMVGEADAGMSPALGPIESIVGSPTPTVIESRAVA